MSIAQVQPRANPFAELAAILTRHRHLTLAMTKREITDRHAGQVLGGFWTIGHPLILMAVYTFVFVYVFKMRLGGTHEMPLDYTTYLLSAMIPWMAFQESMAKGSTVIVINAGLVKQVVFPIEILPIKGVLASLVTQGIATALLATYVLVTNGTLPWTYGLLPVLWSAQLLAMLGTSYLLAAIGTYFRDMKDFVQVGCLISMYTCPICYLPQWVPDLVRPALYANPFSYMVWCFQDACYFGRIDHPWAWCVFITGSLFVFALGYATFRKLKVHFGSVL